MFDRTVMPSGFPAASSDARATVERQFDANFALRVGYTVRAHYPGDPGFAGEHFVTYDVVTEEVDRSGALTYREYQKVRVLNMLGGEKDISKVRFHVPAGYQSGSIITKDILKQCSVVGLFCANGRAHTAYIIGASDHPFAEKDAKSDGHMLKFIFNGVEQSINKDGELLIKATGSTLDPGTNSYKQGELNTYIKIDKEGRIQLTDGEGTVLTIDRSRHKITLDAPKVEVTNRLTVGAGATGVFTSLDGKVVTVQNGIVTGITG